MTARLSFATRRQSFANAAYARVCARKAGLSGKVLDDYANGALELAILIRRNGLQLVIAFLRARQGGYAHLADDLCASLEMSDAPAETGQYMVATRRAIEAADYFKRFAQSVLDVEPGGSTSPSKQEEIP